MSTSSDTSADAFLEALRAEYEMAQEKIDHIGEFKFRVKGWSLTLQTALIASLLSGKANWIFEGYIPIAITAAAVFVILLFHSLDQQQNDLSVVLGRRAKEIEKILNLSIACKMHPEDERKRDLLDAQLGSFNGSPRLAHIVGVAAQRPIKSFIWSMCDVRLNCFYISQYVFTALMIGVIWFVVCKNQESRVDSASSLRLEMSWGSSSK